MEKKRANTSPSSSPRKIKLQRSRTIFPHAATRSLRTVSAAGSSAATASSALEEQHTRAGAGMSRGGSSPGPQPLLYLEESEELLGSTVGEERQEQSLPLSPPDGAPIELAASSSTGTTSSSTTTSSAAISTQSQQQTTSQSSPRGTCRQQQSNNIVRPRGSLWDHFSSDEEDPRRAKCSVCKAVVRRGNDPRHLSSSALRTHLERHHPKLLPGTGRKRGVVEEGGEMEAEGAPAKETAGRGSSPSDGGRTSRQPTLQDVLPLTGVQRVRQRNKGMAQEATTRVVGEMVALSGVPLSFVESPGFLHLIKYLAPWYQPPSRRTLSRRVLPSLYHSVRDTVRLQLSRAKGRKIHFTSDLWSGVHHSYLCLTAHWWQPEDVLAAGVGPSEAGPPGEPPLKPPGYRVALLQARSMEESATGRNICEVFLSALREWSPEGELSRGRMVTDAGRNMLAALREADIQGIVCLAHKIHLVVRDALGLGSQVRENWDQGTQETRALLEKCRQLVGHFSRSVKAARQLREKQEQAGAAEHVLLQDVATRWNSTFEMVSRLVEQKAVLEDIMSSTPILPGGRELGITATDWLALSQMVDVLKPFEETTKAVCGLDASLGNVIPLIRCLDRGLNSFLAEGSSLLPRNKALVSRLQAGVLTRLHPLCGHRDYQLACLCDPRVKGSLASSPAELQVWKAELSLEVRRVQEAQGRPPALPGMRGSQVELGEGSSQESVQPGPGRGRASRRQSKPPPFVASVIAWAVSSSAEERPPEEQDSAESMVKDYLGAPLQPPTSDPLSYWASKAEIWPQLSSVAMDLLSIPPTSVQSERVFSQLGDILRPRRSRLDPETVERLAFIRFNLSAMGSPSPKT